MRKKPIKLTERKALQLCLELWKWLKRQTTQKNQDELDSEFYLLKEQWLGWDKAGKMPNDCPCCQFVVQKFKVTNPDCYSDFGDRGTKQREFCPLKKLWPYGCCATGSPYNTWCDNSDPAKKRAAAQRIIDACKRQLKTL